MLRHATISNEMLQIQGIYTAPLHSLLGVIKNLHGAFIPQGLDPLKDSPIIGGVF